MKLFENRTYVLMLGSFRDRAIESVLECFAGISFEKSQCCRKGNYSSQALNEQLRRLFYMQYCNQVLRSRMCIMHIAGMR